MANSPTATQAYVAQQIAAAVKGLDTSAQVTAAITAALAPLVSEIQALQAQVAALAVQVAAITPPPDTNPVPTPTPVPVPTPTPVPVPTPTPTPVPVPTPTPAPLPSVGSWTQVPNSAMTQVVYAGPLAAAIHAVEGPVAVMNDWSGAALDPDSHNLIVWGGGHSGYFGNEVYAFNLQSETWSMLKGPSDPTGWNQTDFIYPSDGNPISTHTYDAMQITGSKLYSLGGTAPNGNTSSNYWALDLKALTWKLLGQLPGANVDMTCAYDAKTDSIFATTNSMSGLSVFNIATGAFSSLNGTGQIQNYHNTCAIDPVHRTLVSIGGGNINVVDLATGNITNPTTTGPQTCQAGSAPGFVWYAPGACFIGWNGGNILYALNPTTWAWTAFTLGGAVPTAPNGNGTFGRFNYDPGLDQFIVVNQISDPVFVCKISASVINAAPPQPVAPPVMVTNPDGTTAGPFQTLQAAHDAMESGATVNYAANPLAPGYWIDSLVATKNMTLVGAAGCKIQGQIVDGGVGTISVHSASFTVSGVEGFGCVGDGSASFFRLQPTCNKFIGTNLNLHSNDMGILGSPNWDCAVELHQGTFGGNGSAQNAGSAHDVYISSIASLLVDGATFTGCTNAGHRLKCRALATTVQNSSFTLTGNDDSRLIDLPMGGQVLIQNSVFAQSTTEENNECIGIGQEIQSNPDPAGATRTHSYSIISNKLSSTKTTWQMALVDLAANGNVAAQSSKNQISEIATGAFSYGTGTVAAGGDALTVNTAL